MQWNESYATGIPQIDDQHKSLFKAVAAMATAVEGIDGASEYQRLLGFLELYCRQHFAFEEGCMERHRCPSALANKQQHEGLLQLIGEHRRHHARHGYDEHDAHVLVNSLRHWLHNHIGRVDRQLRLCVKASLD